MNKSEQREFFLIGNEGKSKILSCPPKTAYKLDRSYEKKSFD